MQPVCSVAIGGAGHIFPVMDEAGTRIRTMFLKSAMTVAWLLDYQCWLNVSVDLHDFCER